MSGKRGRISFSLREYRPGDEEGMISCIRDEYGNTYFKRDFYNPSYFKKETESGHITFLVAETKEGRIAGMLALKSFETGEGICEIASQIFRKEYRGYGLAFPFFEYGMEILERRHYSAAYCLPVLFHDVTQRLLYRLGLRATGFLLNVFDMQRITHSYRNGRNTKHSQGIQVRAMEKRDAGKIYLPEEHRAFCRRIYESLEVAYCMAEEGTDEGKIPSVSGLEFWQNERQSSLEIQLYSVGMDLEEQLQQIYRKFPLIRRQTANLLLNIGDENAVWAYEKLKGAGYFFTGLKPLCRNGEYMILHHPGEVAVHFQDYVLSEEFSCLAEYVRVQYEIAGGKGCE